MPATSAPKPTTPKQIWQNAKADLEIQLARATYDTWVRDTQFIAYEDGEFVIGVSSSFALDWLNTRLRPVIKRSLSRLADRSVDVRFVAQTKPARSSDRTSAPLLQTSSQSHSAALSPELQSELVDALGPRARSGQRLNDLYTFENYVVGDSNRLAYVASRTVAEQPAQAYNPIFLYGGVGLGKTHLLHSMGHEARRRGRNILYVPAEGFTNDYVESLRHGSPEAFRDRYREVDMLLLDDVQFIAGKPGTQEELFHTFNALHMSGKQVALSADSMPDQIAALEKRLSSRFKSGLCVDLRPPGVETRLAILRHKCEAMGYGVVPDEVLDFISRRLPGSVRRLEGALNRVVIQSRVSQRPLSIKLAESALSDWVPMQSAAGSQDILDLVASNYDVTVDDLKGRGRAQRIALPRQVATILLHEEGGLNRSQIGRLLGGRDHSTVSYGLARVNELAEADADLRRQLRQLREQLRVPVMVKH